MDGVELGARKEAWSPSGLDRLLDELVANAHRLGDKVAIVESGGRWHRLLGTSKRTITYAELGRRIEALEANLIAAGMREGDRVVYGVRTGIDSMTILPALLRIGACVVAVDSAVNEMLFEERMALVAPKWVIAESILYSLSARSPFRGLLRRLGVDLPTLSSIRATHIRVGARLPGVPTSLSFDDLIAKPSMPLSNFAERMQVADDRDALVVFTSGTTSLPKGVVHTATSLGAACRGVVNLCRLSPDDVVYSTQTHQILAALVSGSVAIVPPTGVDPERFLLDAARFRVTHAYGVPYEFAQLVTLLESRGERLPESIRTIVLASAPTRRAFLRRMRDRCHESTDIWCAYAMTEMLPVALVESREKLASEDDGDLVGTLVTGAEARIADDGELFLRGENLFRGYLAHEPVREHATGDLARLDSQGRIVLLGRKKEMLIRREHNIYPSLYEESLSAIAGIDVCAMVSVETADASDDQIVLAVQPRVGEVEAELRTRIERALVDGTCPIDRFAHPDHIVFCELPFGGRSNKLDRGRLATIVRQELSHER